MAQSTERILSNLHLKKGLHLFLLNPTHENPVLVNEMLTNFVRNEPFVGICTSGAPQYIAIPQPDDIRVYSTNSTIKRVGRWPDLTPQNPIEKSSQKYEFGLSFIDFDSWNDTQCIMNSTIKVGCFVQDTLESFNSKTLFFGNFGVKSQGCLLLSYFNSPFAVHRTRFKERPITPKLTIKDAFGNIIKKIEGVEHYANSIYDTLRSSGSNLRVRIESESFNGLFEMVSGDPGKGILAIDTNDQLEGAETIQFVQVESDTIDAKYGIQIKNNLTESLNVESESVSNSSNDSASFTINSSLGYFYGDSSESFTRCNIDKSAINLEIKQ